MTHRRFAFPAAVLAAFALSQPVAEADTSRTRTDYTVSLIALPVASLTFVTQLEGAGFSISGSMKTSPLADIVEKTRGSAQVSGRMASDRLLASHFAVSYTSGDKTHSTEMVMKNGTVVSAVNKPEKKTRPAGWVPVKAEHLRAVLDPLSSLVIPAGGAVCPRKLPIFDGETRYDLVLEAKDVRPFSTRGFKGKAEVCTVRLVPHAGYRKGNKNVDYIRKLRGIEIWFAKSPNGNFHAPVYARVPTKIGPVIVAATRFGV